MKHVLLVKQSHFCFERDCVYKCVFLWPTTPLPLHLTVQTLPAVWDLTGRCLGCLLEEVSSLSCTLSNLEVSFHL